MFDFYLTNAELRDMKKHNKNNGFIMLDNGRSYILKDKNIVTLRSYYTDVLQLNTKTGNIKKLWNGYSSTTSKHIGAFLTSYGLPDVNKKTWLALPCNKFFNLRNFLTK